MSEKRSIGPVTGATTAAAAATTVLFWLLGQFGVTAPGEVQGAVTTLLVVIAGYIVTPRGGGKRAAG